MFSKILVWLGLKKVEAEKKLDEVKAEVKEIADKVEAKVEAAQVEVEKAVEKVEVEVAKVKEKVARKPRAPKVVAPPPPAPTKRGRKAKG
jgi:chromosome segregation ATPase